MIFQSQKSQLTQLSEFSKSKCHSILIHGPKGSGKTHLAKQYADMLHVTNFQIIKCDVATIRETIDSCISLKSDVVLCLENLDTAVLAASYTILKFLEEPLPNVYIVVTCRNIEQVPDTILSRSVVVTCSCPTDSDIEQYAESENLAKFSTIKHTDIWRAVKSFSDAKLVLDMSSDHLSYFGQIDSLMKFQDSVSNIVWALGHYSDNTETPIQFVLQYIMTKTSSKTIKQAAMACIRDLALSKVSAHAALSRFAFEAKYVE